MKAQTADYQFRTFCLRIVAINGLTIRLTQYPRDMVMGNGQVYLSTVGYEFTGYQGTASFSPSVVDLEGISGYAGVTMDAVSSGVFDNARCYLFATSWVAPVEDFEPIVCCLLGKTTMEDDRYRIEEMALIDTLNQTVGKTYTASCQKRFGSQGFAECKKVPTVINGTLTAATSQFTFADSAIFQTAGFFTEGKIQFTGGLNAGLKAQEIRLHSAGGVILLHEPTYYMPSIGDTYTLTEGCVKTQAACIAKGNILNFGGFPTIPTSTTYLQRGTK